MGRKARKKNQRTQEKVPSTKATSSVPAKNLFEIHHVRALLLIGLVVFVAYANTLDNDLVHDDRIEILQNPYIQDFSYLPKILTSPAWAFRSEANEQMGSNYYRPVQYLTYSILYHLFGASPWGYHAYKLLLHLFVCLIFYWITSQYWQEGQVALFCSLLFAVHPINTEAVSWVSGITDVSCALFFLIALWLHLKDQARPSIVTRAGFCFFFLVGMFTKETMVTFIPLLFFYDWMKAKKFPASRDMMRIYLPLVMEFLVYLSLRIHAIGSFTSSQQLRYDFLNGFQMFCNQIVLLANYFLMFFFPIHLNAYRLFEPILSPFEPPVVLALGIIAILLTFFFLVYRRSDPPERQLLPFGLIWFLLALSPVLVFLKRIGENVFAERYLYLPGIGLCLSVSLPLAQLRKSRPRLAVTAWIGLLCILTWRTIDRNKIWQDELVFYEATAKASPRAGNILNNLGTVYAAKVRYADALKAFETSIAVQPTYPAYKNLGPIYAALGRFDESIAAYERAATFNPRDAGIYSGLGDLYFARQRFPEAIVAYQKGVNLKPNDSRLLFNLADACATEKRFDDALATYERILSINPQEKARAYRGMARVYMATNQTDKAAIASQMAMSAKP